MNVTDLEVSSLVAQWVGAVASALAVIVAVVFGAITLATSRRSIDTQERATLTATGEPTTDGFANAVEALTRVRWEVLPDGGEHWLMRNGGSHTAHEVTIAGLTELDQRRLSPDDPEPSVVGPTSLLGFTLVSRFTLSGPANVVMTFALEPGGEKHSRVLKVPAP